MLKNIRISLANKKCSDQPHNDKMTNLTPILKFQYSTDLA